MPYQFHGQRPNELVVLLCKQHPAVLIFPFFQVSLIWLIPWVFYVFLDIGPVLSWVIAVCSLAGLARTLRAWHSWSNSVCVLTDERVIVLAQHGMFSREFSECGLNSIQQVSHKIKGMFHTVFGFGDIAIFTGGAHEAFIVPNMPDPYEMQQEIQRLAAGEAA